MNDTENLQNHMKMDLKQNPRREISSSEQLQPIKTQKKRPNVSISIWTTNHHSNKKI